MLCKQQQIKGHIIPGDTGTALQPLGNLCGEYTAGLGTEAKSLPESCTGSQFI